MSGTVLPLLPLSSWFGAELRTWRTLHLPLCELSFSIH